MKILQINTVFDKTSTGKIVFDIKQELDKKEIDNYVIFGRGKSSYNDDKNVIKVTSEFESNLSHFNSYISGFLYGGNISNTDRIISQINKIKPDIVHLHCLNGFYVNIPSLIKFLKEANYKTVLTLHADFMFTGTCGYSYECEKYNDGCGACSNINLIEKNFLIDNTHKNNMRFIKSFDGFKNLKVVSVSPYLEKKSSESKILSPFDHYCVFNGIDTDVFRYIKDDDMSSKFNNKDVVLHVTSNFNFDEKGGLDFIELAKLNETNNNLLFVIVGSGKCNFQLPKNVIFYGRTNDQNELAKIYSYAKVCIIPSRCETFSMVVAESLCCGTPIIGYYSGGPETIALEKYSSFCQYKDITELNKLLNIQLSKKIVRNTISKAAKEKYSKELMVDEYLRIYKSFNID
jgi:glycosyltransferase involved in cell wall biosynthesis